LRQWKDCAARKLAAAGGDPEAIFRPTRSRRGEDAFLPLPW